VNVAATEVGLLIVTVHVLVPLQPPPDQPVKVEPFAGCAISVTGVPLKKEAEHVVPQLILPESSLTVPPPVPAFVTVRV
jgi:hypothetical protein